MANRPYHLEVLGRIDFRTANGNELRAVLAQPKRLALLAYLALASASGAVRRDKLLATFWPELNQERARKALNKAIHFLRQELGDDVIPSRSGDELAVDRAHLVCDAEEFVREVEGRNEAAALELYRGELLPAFYIEGAPAFDEWLEQTRTKVRNIAARASHSLAEQREREGRYTIAVSFARRAVELSDEDERTVRRLLELLDRLGDRAGALYAYDRFERRMAAEFNASPAAETQALIARIRARVNPNGDTVRADAARIEPPLYRPQSDESLATAFARRGYQLVRELGHGGMATVYLARDAKHDRQVALKVLSPEVGALRLADRFAAEIRVTANLQHPNILPLFDSGEVQGTLFYAMPYVEGESLRARLEREKQLSVDEAMALVRTLCAALEYAHMRGVIHRDIKPENILLQAGQPLLADFGIALALSSAGVERITATGLSLGTPQYMSPEQAAGELVVGPQSDVYSLAAVAYELLTGEPPFTGPNTRAVLARVMLEPPRAIRTVRSSVPEPMERAILRALAKHPKDRFVSAEAFAADLETAVVRQSAFREFLGGKRPLWVVGLALIALTSVLSIPRVLPFRPGSGFAAPQPQPKWVLMAEIGGPAGDPTLGAVVREIVTSALDQSTTLATVSPEQIELARRAARLPDSAHITGDVARHLALRTEVAGVVEGRVDRVNGATYSVLLRATTPRSGSTVGSIHGTATASGFVASIDTLARRFAQQLESQARITGVRAAVAPDYFATPSLDAYRKFVEAKEAERIDFAPAIARAREAVAADTEFAAAWAALYEWYLQTGNPDSAKTAYARAMRFASRLTPVEAGALEANAARRAGDAARATQLYDRLIQQDPTRAEFYSMRALPLRDMARYEDAIQSLQRAATLSPLGNGPDALIDLAETLAAAGRVAEARAVARPLQGDAKLDAEMDIELAAGNWTRAESLATLEMTTPAYSVQRRSDGATNLASSLAGRGQIARAYDALKRAIEIGGGQRSPVLSALLLGVARGTNRVPPDFLAPYDTNLRAPTIARALAQAWKGDTREAGRQLAILKGRNFPLGSPGYANIALVEGSIAFVEGRWRDAIGASAETAWIGQRGAFAAGTNLMRWFVAESYERLGQLDSAAAYFDLLVRPVRTTWGEQSSRGLAHPFAHRRLALLYTRMGRRSDAHLHWKLFLETVRQPDADLGPLVVEARAGLAQTSVWSVLMNFPRIPPRS